MRNSVRAENQKMKGNVTMSVEDVEDGEDSSKKEDEANPLSTFVRCDVRWNESSNRVEAEMTTKTAKESTIMKDGYKIGVINFNKRMKNQMV